MHRPSPVVLSALLAAAALIAGCASGPRPISNLSEFANASQDVARRENSAAVALIDAGDLAAAERHLRLAIAADPTFGPAQNNLGHVFFAQARYYEAATAFGQAARLMPRQGEPPNNLGLVFEATGKLDDAAEHYARAIAADPGNLTYLANSARARVRRGERSEALRSLLRDLSSRGPSREWEAWAGSALQSMPPITAGGIGASESATRPSR